MAQSGAHFESDNTLRAQTSAGDSASSMSHVDAHGAVDLSASSQAGAVSNAPAPGAVQLDAPLITQITDQTFQQVTSVSQTVPVVLAIWSSHSLGGKEIITTLESIARQYGGRFQLATIEAEQAPAIVQALQLQVLPTVLGMVGGRPVPLFQGSANREQMTPVIDQLLQAAAQMGITGQLHVSQQEQEDPIPDEYQPALDAEQAGYLDQAVAEWEKVVERLPKDQRAKNLLAAARIRQRMSTESGDDPAAIADQMFEAGQIEQAFQVLLAVVRDDVEHRDAARTRLLDLFRVAGNTAEVRRARATLASLLLV